jgi:hypothetical protein
MKEKVSKANESSSSLVFSFLYILLKHHGHLLDLKLVVIFFQFALNHEATSMLA